MARRNGVADAALDFHAEDERRQHLPAGQLARFCQRKYRRRNRCRGMNDRFRMGVVEIEKIRRDGIDERRPHRIEPFGPADDGRVRRTAEWQQCPQGDRDRRIMGRADGCGEKIQDRPLGLMLLRRDIRP
jgi:hypothetical protein